MGHETKPLYRKVNTRARNVHHDFGGDFRHDRQRAKSSDRSRSSMHAGHQRGLDYTPLFKFLLSKVGENWDDVFSEAVSRLDKQEPIFRMVALEEQDRQESIRVGESTYYSGLYVDDQNVLRVVNPSLAVEQMTPSCPCCTHTFNGIKFTKKYR